MRAPVKSSIDILRLGQLRAGGSMECLPSQTKEVKVPLPSFSVDKAEDTGTRYLSFYYLNTLPVIDLGPYVAEIDLTEWINWQSIPIVQYVLKDFWSCLDTKALLFDSYLEKLYQGNLETIVDFVLEENMKIVEYQIIRASRR